jgi:hypothetical protein
MPDNQALYQDRWKRILDTIALKKTDRVPITPLVDVFPIRCYNVLMKDAIEDYSLLDEASLRFHREYQPDSAESPYFPLGIFKTLRALDFRTLKWAGNGLPDNSDFQYQDVEIMGPDHYDWYLSDPSDFTLRYLFPKLYGRLAPLAGLPHLAATYSYADTFNWFALAAPGIKEAGEAMMAAADQAAKTLAAGANFAAKLAEAGFPRFVGALTQAPLDIIADFFRGIKGLLGDLKRRPDKVLATCERLTPMLIKKGVDGCRASGIPICFIPLHMCMDNLMSQEQFERFYWPFLLEVIRGLVAEKIHPYVVIEGVCDRRLPVMIRDAPPATCVYHLEGSDIFEAKKLARDKVALRGNLPVSLLMTGTPDDVRACCKRLIDGVAPGGGYMMDTGVTLADAKPENVKAMFDYTREYGVY